MSSSNELCSSCHRPLQLLVETEAEGYDQPVAGATSSGDGSYVDDDVHMQCGCHFHWECLLDAYSVTECPSCGKSFTSISSIGEQQILCNLKNEGGLQEQLDILPLLTEEAYLKTYPEERKCQAFLEFCGEGDIEAIVDLLNDEGEEGGENTGRSAQKTVDILRYQDHIRTMNSGLHVAIQNQRAEVAWLLLLLASTLDISQFPTDVLRAAEGIGLMREDQAGKEDIRILQDGDGLTAEQRAASLGGFWEEWIEAGRLRAPA